MIHKNLRTILMLIFVVLIVVFIVLALIYTQNSEFDIITYISGLSSFMIALLTILYVLTTSKQLDIMQKQLTEMKIDRELQSQPLPYLEDIKIKVEKPRFFYAPPTDEYSFQSRYILKSNIYNFSNSPAICIDIMAKIIIPQDSNKIVLKCTEYRVDVLEGKSKLNKEISFLFVSDCNASFFGALRGEYSNSYPRLIVKAYYRNVTGGCFRYTNEYYIVPNLDKADLTLNWHTNIVSFTTKFKESLKNLRYLNDANKEKWKELFKNVKQDANNELIDDNLELKVRANVGKFDIMRIERKEFNSAVDKNFYGHFIGEKPQSKIKELDNNQQDKIN